MKKIKVQVNEVGKLSELSDCELLTMKCIWDAGESVTASEVITALRETYNLKYKDTTVYTFIQKLKDKGFVDSYRRGVTFYFPVRDKSEFCSQRMLKEKDLWFNGSAGEMIETVIKASELSDEEKEQIKRLANEL